MKQLEQNSQEEVNQTSEYLPAISGIKIKITDAILALFTTLLFFATLWLYFATDGLASGAESTAEKQLRAYMSIDQIDNIVLVDRLIQNRAIGYGISAKWRNAGQTPAKHLEVENMRCFMMNTVQDNVPSFIRPNNANPIFLDAGPNGTSSTQPVNFSIEEIRQILDQTAKAYVCFTCKYNDVFAGQRERGANREILCLEVQVIVADPSVAITSRSIFAFSVVTNYKILDNDGVVSNLTSL